LEGVGAVMVDVLVTLIFLNLTIFAERVERHESFLYRG